MRILFAGGGTGGHLYPGLAIARALVRADASVEPFFIGARRGVERDILPTAGFPYELLDLHPLYRRDIWNNWKTVAGAVGAWRAIGRIASADRPRALVGTGGYGAGLAMAYAVGHNIALVQQVGDSFPGLTARVFSKYSVEIYLNYPEAAARLRAHHEGSLIDTGAPIEPPPVPRPDRAAARLAWGFGPGVHTVVLVSGGSQGSRAINRAVAAWIKSGLPEGIGIVWATGRTTYDEFSNLESPVVKVKPYIAPIADVYAAADLSIGRAGATSTAELLAWGVPMVLIPLPTAAADHQTTNARSLVEAGAAVMISEAALTGDSLAATVGPLLDDPAKLGALAEGAHRRARPNAASVIADRILAIARQRRG